MTTRFGRNVLQDLADLSGREVPEMSVGRLASRYAGAVEERKRRDAENARELRLNIPHMVQVQNRIAERLEEEASEVNGKLPVASTYEAYRHVHARKDRESDPGLRALHGHLERMWKRNRTSSITANLYLTLHDHYSRNFPKSAAAEVIVEIGQNGYTTLPLSDLTHIASTIETQEDFDHAVVYHGLNGQLPHQVKARRFILALLNIDDEDNTYGLEGMENSPPFVGEEGEEVRPSFVPPRQTPQKDVKTRGPKAHRTAQWSSDSIEELRDYLSRDLYLKDAETDIYFNRATPDEVVHVGIIWTESGYAAVEGMVYISERHPDEALQEADDMWEHYQRDSGAMKEWEDDAREELRRDRSLIEGEPSDEEVWELADEYMRGTSNGRVWTVTMGDLLNMLESMAPENENAQLILNSLGEIDDEAEEHMLYEASWKKALEEEMPRRTANWMDNTGQKIVVDYDVRDENAPVTLVGVYSDLDPSEPVYLMLTQSGTDHALEKTLSEWQNKQLEDHDEGIMQEITEELGPGASEDEVFDRYFEAMTENWNYFEQEYPSVADLVQELEASDNPDAQDVLGWMGL